LHLRADFAAGVSCSKAPVLKIALLERDFGEVLKAVGHYLPYLWRSVFQNHVESIMPLLAGFL
jgi:hypothetical protein